MAKLDLLKKAAQILRKSDHYLRNKESNFSSRFDFVQDKKNGAIYVYNAEKGEDLFLWDDYLNCVVGALGLSHYITIDKFDVKKLVYYIY